jgi:hypothetical protein
MGRLVCADWQIVVWLERRDAVRPLDVWMARGEGGAIVVRRLDGRLSFHPKFLDLGGRKVNCEGRRELRDCRVQLVDAMQCDAQWRWGRASMTNALQYGTVIT